jgi:nucleotide-binding universal stress UspA family protein
LIVILDRGHKLLDRLMLGSTSSFVLRHANNSVLVVKEKKTKMVSQY